MNKFFIILMAIVAITTGTVIAMGYGQPQYGQPYGQQFPQQQYGQPCSKQALVMKQQKNAMQCQQETLGCQYGDPKACSKAQKDCFDVQKYAQMIQQCPYP